MSLKEKIRKRKPKAPDHLQEEPSDKGGCGKKVKGGKVPAVFEPKFLEQCDGRCTTIRILKEKTDQLQTESGADSLAKKILCERAAFLVAVIETREVQAIETGEFNAGSYVQAVNSLIGLLKTIGLEIDAVESSLSSYIEHVDGNKE